MLIQAGTKFAIQSLQQWFISRPARKPVSQEQEESSCTPCTIHQHLVLAHAYVRNLHIHLNADGSIPAGLGGTIQQARDHIHEASLEIPQVVGTHPTIDAACNTLASLLPDIYTRLQNIQSKEQWDEVLDLLAFAEDVSYDIPATVFRRDLTQPEPEFSQDVVAIIGESDRDLLNTIKKVRTGEMTRQEAVSYLGSLLGGE